MFIHISVRDEDGDEDEEKVMEETEVEEEVKDIMRKR